MDRAIAEQLGGAEVDDSDIAELIEKLTDHEWQLASEEAELQHFESSREEAEAKAKEKKAENIVKDLREQSQKNQQARKKQQREMWELERPQLGVRRVQLMAALEESQHDIDAEFAERLRQLREKRAIESAADLAMEPTPWVGASNEPSHAAPLKLSLVGEDEDVQKPISAADTAAASAGAARAAASRAARNLAGVSDASLAEALVAMEASCAAFYRKTIYTH